jgi:hypothetical protein
VGDRLFLKFYRMKEHGEKNCIYFIIDNTLPLLLYVGETMQTVKQMGRFRGFNGDIMDRN